MKVMKLLRNWRIQQILMGLGMLVLCALICAMAMTGKTVEDRDATLVLLFAPMGLYLLFTKKRVIY